MTFLIFHYILPFLMLISLILWATHNQINLLKISNVWILSTFRGDQKYTWPSIFVVSLSTFFLSISFSMKTQRLYLFAVFYFAYLHFLMELEMILISTLCVFGNHFIPTQIWNKARVFICSLAPKWEKIPWPNLKQNCSEKKQEKNV